MTRQLDRWTIAFYVLMGVGLVAATYHFASGRYANGAIAVSAVIVGLLIQREIAAMPEATQQPRASRSDAGPAARWQGSPANRTNWLSNSIIAGFPATVVMTVVFIAGFLFSGAFGAQDGTTVSRWFWGLTNNSLTDSAYNIPIGAYSVNLLAGLVWAGVYGYVAEPRLSGPGWRKGMLFSIVPWLLSLVVVFPIVGAGFFGAALGAGPLPAIGNLILHLVFGAVLGSIYAVPDESMADAAGTDGWESQAQNRGMVIGMVGGLVTGMIAGSALGLIVSPGNATETEMLLAGAAVGTMIGAIAGPLFGLSAGSREQARSPR
ncbi:MAG: hypothetical protein H0V47_09320 [Chloroflexia bacterium]|nr:hypothetical protein [Chloroflexia bacterium]